MSAAKCKLFCNFSVTSDCSALPLLSSIGAATRLFSSGLSIEEKTVASFLCYVARVELTFDIYHNPIRDGMPVMSTRHPSPLHELIRLSGSTCARMSSRTLFTFTFTLVFQFLNSVLKTRPTVVEGFSHILIILRLYAHGVIESNFLHRLIFLEMPCSHFLR